MRRMIVPVILVVALAVAGYFGYTWWTGQSAAQAVSLTASVIIETTEVTVSGESAGRVTSVTVAEGDAVTAGQPLVQFDDTLMQSQRNQAEAAVEAAQGAVTAAQAQVTSAQANLAVVQAGARPQEIAAGEQAVLAAQANVESAQGQLAQTRGALEAAKAVHAQAVARYAQLEQGARPEAVDAASVRMQQAAAAVQIAQSNYDRVKNDPNAGSSPQALALQDATLAYEAAKSNYQGVIAGATTPELDQARAGIDQAAAGMVQATAVVSQTLATVSAAEANASAAQSRLDLLKAGSRTEQIQAAEAVVAAAEAQAGAAESQVKAAQADVKMVDDQIARLAVVAPIDGVILVRSIQPGEVALPGSPLLTLGDLTRLTVIVYLPEDQYGLVKVGDHARLSVDSFPGKTFDCTVEHIADQAEFTPRNVQTAEGRKTTVFAVKLAIDNAGGGLKPGMPADVAFGG